MNRRPLGPEPSTLAGLSYAPNVVIIIEPYSLGKEAEIVFSKRYIELWVDNIKMVEPEIPRRARKEVNS